MKKQNTKTNEMQERAKYTPASMRVLSLTAANIICGSGGYPTEFEEVNDI